MSTAPNDRLRGARRVLPLMGMAALLLSAPATLAQSAPKPVPPDQRHVEGPRVGGRLAYVSQDDLDMVGDAWVDLPLGSPGPGTFFTSWYTRSAISGTSDFAFTVRDLEYRLDIGWRHRLPRGIALSLRTGQRGRTEVDAFGSAWVRYVAVGASSEHFGREPEPELPVEGVSWNLVAGPVLEESGIRADAFVHGEVRARLFGDRLALDLELDGLIDGGSSDFDVTVGPSFGVPFAGGRRMALFVRYLDAGSPLGIQNDSWLAGFEFTEGPAGFVSRGAQTGADIAGFAALGAGADRRESAQLFLRFQGPVMPGQTRVTFSLDVNALTASDAYASAVATDELYYLYDIGIERPLRYRPGVGNVMGVVGLYFYHRSNHQLDNPGTVTSINVAEVGAETPHWHGRGPRPAGRLGALDARLRAGYLLDSAFGLDHRWHARGGLRWQLPIKAWGGRLVPFLRAEAETGDVNRRTFSAGIFLNAFEIQIQRRTDDQYFGQDEEATLLTAGYSF